MRYPMPWALNSTPYAGRPPILTGSAIAGAPMSEPFGPGPGIPCEQPEQDVPGEMGMLLRLALWSYSFVMVQLVPEQNETCGAELSSPPVDARPMFRGLP